MSTTKTMTRADAAAYIAGLSLVEKRQLAAFLRIMEDPAADTPSGAGRRRQGLLESSLEAERGGKEAAV